MEIPVYESRRTYDGILTCEFWTIQSKNQFLFFYYHREDGPAIIEYKQKHRHTHEVIVEKEEWYINNLLHRLDGPAQVLYYFEDCKKSESWFQNGKYHREDGPAYIEYDMRGNICIYQWIINSENVSDYIENWLENNTFGIPLSYKEWTDDHKMIFKLACGSIMENGV